MSRFDGLIAEGQPDVVRTLLKMSESRSTVNHD